MAVEEESQEMEDPLSVIPTHTEEIIEPISTQTEYMEESKKPHADLIHLRSLVSKLEMVSDKMAEAAFGDSYDQFGKYIASLLRGLPEREVISLKNKMVESVLQVKLGQEKKHSSDAFPSVPKKSVNTNMPAKEYLAVVKTHKENPCFDPSKVSSVYNKNQTKSNKSDSKASPLTIITTSRSSKVRKTTNIDVPKEGSLEANRTFSTIPLPVPDTTTTISMDDSARIPFTLPITTYSRKPVDASSVDVSNVTKSPTRRPVKRKSGGTRKQLQNTSAIDETAGPSLPKKKVEELPLIDRLSFDNTDTIETAGPLLPKMKVEELPLIDRLSFDNTDTMNTASEFEIDVEEGTELNEVKPDVDPALFESVLCGEVPLEMKIKEEPPDIDDDPKFTPTSTSSEAIPPGESECVSSDARNETEQLPSRSAVSNERQEGAPPENDRLN